ncbi:hypothetical protein [Myxococcus qinghaiensis]|uniref:hypothetical protein n=1 Tax=Myxococcus qinghaiensis TaxID=2906758 RepID=UPI0020A7A6DF|nr:hypothetical protein [Myxococcus qinghaiensis]MCP3163932.1 hypothetical protein [Myxococcus qinghaiensis]
MFEDLHVEIRRPNQPSVYGQIVRDLRGGGHIAGEDFEVRIGGTDSLVRVSLGHLHAHPSLRYISGAHVEVQNDGGTWYGQIVHYESGFYDIRLGGGGEDDIIRVRASDVRLSPTVLAMPQSRLLAAWTPNIAKAATGSEHTFLARLRRGFEEHIPGFGRLPQDVVNQVLPDLVRRWFYDVGFGINSSDWWPVLDGFPPQMQGQVSAFAKALADCFIAQMKQSRASLAGILKRYTHLLLVVEEVRKRFDDAAYGLFVQQLSDRIVVDLPLMGILGGEMSGDMFGIGATLIAKPNSLLMVTQKDDPLDHSDSLVAFTSACVNGGGRVRKVVLPKGKSVSETIRKEAFAWMQQANCICWLKGYELGTRFLNRRELWSGSDLRNRIRNTWGVSDVGGFPSKQGALAAWLEKRHQVPVRKLDRSKVLVIWSRFTGKKGEIHLEHDTSFEGTRQLIDRAFRAWNFDFVFIAGDKPIVHRGVDSPEKRIHKFDQMCEDLGKGRAFNLTCFWEDETSRTWCGNRMDQFKLYEYLHRVADTRHLGMRSGNLEAMALMGYWVRYMEEVGSWGASRMTHWHAIGLGYERIVISQPPTRSGKHFVHVHREVPEKPSASAPKMMNYLTFRNHGFPGTVQVAKPKAEPKPPDISKYAKGFDPKDLVEIGVHLTSVNWSRR